MEEKMSKSSKLGLGLVLLATAATSFGVTKHYMNKNDVPARVDFGVKRTVKHDGNTYSYFGIKLKDGRHQEDIQNGSGDYTSPGGIIDYEANDRSTHTYEATDSKVDTSELGKQKHSIDTELDGQY